MEKVKQHFSFDLECPDLKVLFWPIEIRHMWLVLGFCMGINVMLINENEILQPSPVKHKNNNNKKTYWLWNFVVAIVSL